MNYSSNNLHKNTRPVGAGIFCRGTRGFTLIEMIVSLGIFSIVAVVALGALTRIITANKKAQTMQAAVTNLTFALESMSREMRTGKKYYCASSNPSGVILPQSSQNSECSEVTMSGFNRIIAFESTRTANKTPPDTGTCNLVTAYRFIEDEKLVVEKAEQTYCGEQLSSLQYASILDPQVTVVKYGVKTVDDPHQMMFVRISGYVGVTERERTEFDVQTAISARTK